MEYLNAFVCGGLLCVIGTNLNEEALSALFGV